MSWNYGVLFDKLEEREKSIWYDQWQLEKHIKEHPEEKETYLKVIDEWTDEVFFHIRKLKEYLEVRMERC